MQRALKSKPAKADASEDRRRSVTAAARGTCTALTSRASTMTSHRAQRGFTLVEMAVTLLIFGMLLAFSVPALQGMNRTQQLKGTAENIAGQLRLARERAIATGTAVVVHCTMNYPTTWDLHIHQPGLAPGPGWDFPNGITYVSAASPTFAADGRASGSGLIVIRNTRGLRDTISIQSSGLVLVR
jgi:prepilin-type N-terminal cleavage/methylation domain-containing protein